MFFLELVCLTYEVAYNLSICVCHVILFRGHANLITYIGRGCLFLETHREVNKLVLFDLN